MPELRSTALTPLHRELGARVVEFAGYEMPVQYPAGVLKEHLHTRAAAGLFDVSHMGQLRLFGAEAARALEGLVPVDIVELAELQQRYALLTDEHGGILDDLMVTHVPDGLFVVVNAACKEADTRHLQQHLAGRCELVELVDHALLALQGPAASAVLARFAPTIDFSTWTFMTARGFELAGAPCLVTRSGYTGEDGFEISIGNDAAEQIARLLLAEPEVAPVGLGARDSLRLEAGLCLYGQDIDTTTSPVEAGLSWAISKARRADGARPGGFPGAARILAELAVGVERRRVGLVGVERTPVRAGAALVDGKGAPLGTVTSGGFGPSVNQAIAMAYLPTSHAAPGTEVFALVRGRPVPMHVSRTPFTPHRYFRG